MLWYNGFSIILGEFMSRNSLEIKRWKDAKNAEELVAYIESLECRTVDKFIALRWFLENCDNETTIKNMLNEEYFPVKDILKRCIFNGKYKLISNSNNRALLYNYVKGEFMATVDGWIEEGKTASRRTIKHLEFLYGGNREDFFAVLDRLNPEVVYDGCFDGELPSELKNEVVNNRPEIIVRGEFEKFCVKLRDDFDFRRDVKILKHFNEWDLFIKLGRTKGAEGAFKKLLELGIIEKEQILKRFTKKEIASFPECLSHYFREDRWKYFDSGEFVYYNMPSKNRWENFEYLMASKPNVANYIKNQYSEFCFSNIYHHYRGVDLGTLDPKVREFVEPIVLKGEEKRLREKQMRLLSLEEQNFKEKRWYDQDKKLREFFVLAGNFI